MTLRTEITNILQKLFEEKKKEILKKKSEDKPRVEDADRDDETNEEDDDKKKSIVKKDKGAYSKLSTDGDRVVSEALSTSLKREIDSMKKKGMDAVEIAMHMDKKHGNSLKKKDHDDIAAYLSEDTLVDMIEESKVSKKVEAFIKKHLGTARYNRVKGDVRTMVNQKGDLVISDRGHVLKTVPKGEWEDDFPLNEEVSNVDMIEESLGPNFHVLATKGDYVFARDKKENVSVVFYKGREIDSGDFDRGASGWFMNHHFFGRGQKFFSQAKDVVDTFFKNKITEPAEE